MFMIPENQRDIGVLGTYDKTIPYEIHTLKTNYPLDEVEIHRELARLVFEEEDDCPIKFERRYRCFEDVIFWCASYIKVEDLELRDTIFTLSLDGVALPMYQYVMNTRKVEIEKYRKVYEEMKERYEKVREKGLSNLRLYTYDNDEDDNFYNYYGMKWMTDGEEMTAFMLSDKVLFPAEIKELANFVVYTWAKNGGQMNDPFGEELLGNEDKLHIRILTGMVLRSTSVFGLIPCTKEIFVENAHYLRGVPEKDAYYKHKDEIIREVKRLFEKIKKAAEQ